MTLFLKKCKLHYPFNFEFEFELHLLFSNNFDLKVIFYLKFDLLRLYKSLDLCVLYLSYFEKCIYFTMLHDLLYDLFENLSAVS